VRTDLGDYFLRVEKLDRLAGGILRRLEDAGELENTIVVMTSDNGMPFPRCKATLYDRGTRVPLAIRWGKRVKKRRRVQDFVSLTDLAPTFLEAAGLPIPDEMTGASLMKQLKSARSGWIDQGRDHVLTGMERHVYPWPGRALRTRTHLYIRNFEPGAWPTGEGEGEPPRFDFRETPWPTVPGAFSFNCDSSPTKQWLLEHPDRPKAALAFGRRPREELYDLRDDAGQLDNLAGKPAFEKTRRSLRAKLNYRLRLSGDFRAAQPEYETAPVEGWTVYFNRQLRGSRHRQLGNRVEAKLAEKVREIRRLLRPGQVERLQAVPIWMELDNGRSKGEYHPDAKWLREHAVNEAKVESVEFGDAEFFLEALGYQPMMVLHELAHAYHHQVLGFDEERIRAAFRKALLSKSYHRVERHDGQTAKAYALTNHKEYFAETTEAFFGRNDFYPFTAEELREHDPEMHALLTEVWNPGTKSTP